MYFFIIDFSINFIKKHFNLFALVAKTSRLFLSAWGFISLTDSTFLARLRLKNHILNELDYLFEVFSLPFDKLLFRPNIFMVQPLLKLPQENCLAWPYLMSNMADVDLQYSENYFLEIRYLKLKFLYFFITTLLAQFNAVTQKERFNKFDEKGRHLIVSFFDKLNVLFYDASIESFSSTCSFFFKASIIIDRASLKLNFENQLEESVVSPTVILSRAEFFTKLDKIEFIFLDLLNNFNLLINHDKFYEIKADKLLALDLYNKLLSFKHPLFLQISNYFQHISFMYEDMSFKLFDLAVFLDILVAIHIRDFIIYIFQKKKHESDVYDINIELPVIDLEARFNTKESAWHAFGVLRLTDSYISFLDHFDLNILDKFHVCIPLELKNSIKETCLLDKYVDGLIAEELIYITSTFEMVYHVFLIRQARSLGIPGIAIHDRLVLYLKNEFENYLKKNPITKNKYYYIVEHIYKYHIK